MLTPLNHSYVNRWIVDNFPDVCLVDTHLGNIFVHGDIKKQKIVIVDNEELDPYQDFLPNYLKDKNASYICRSNFFKEEQHQQIIKFPYLYTLEDLFALNLLDNKFSLDLLQLNKNDYNFMSLNRVYREPRSILIKYLDNKNLLLNSYVTFHRSTSKIKGLKKPNFDWYKTQGPPDKIYSTYNGIPCTSNLKNYFYIKKKIHTDSCLIVETFLDHFYPTEKSFMPFFTCRLGIILSVEGHIEILRQEGFDVFDDIVDHSYDSINHIQQRIQSAVDLNYDLLKEGITLDNNLYKRLKKNFMHLKYEFFEKQKQKLKFEIERNLK